MARKHGQDRGLKPVTMADGKVWWQARLYHKKKEWRSQAVPTKKEARDIYNAKKSSFREAEYFPAVYQAKQAQRVTVADLTTMVVQDYRRQGHRTLKEAIQLADFWVQLAGATRAIDITGRTLTAWADQWLQEGLAPSTVNNRMNKLLRGYTLAIDEDPPRLFARPKWKPLPAGPPRAGWMEWPTFAQVRRQAPTWVRVPITLAYWTGMRMGEVLRLRWDQLAFYHPIERVAFQLDRTKNKELRTIVWTGDLYEVLAHWRHMTDTMAPLCPWVCHWHGTRIGTIDTAWKTACVASGVGAGTWHKGKGYWTDYQGPLLHDFRRTAVRNLDRAGVSRDIARKITGHKTDSIYSRYNIVSEEDLAEAGAQVVEYVERLHGTGRKPETTTVPDEEAS